MMLSKKLIKPCKLCLIPPKEEYMIKLELLKDLNSVKSKAEAEEAAVVLVVTSFLLKTFLTTFSTAMKCLNAAEGPGSSNRGNITSIIEKKREVTRIPSNCSDSLALYYSLSL